jgi:hypothetical protein
MTTLYVTSGAHEHTLLIPTTSILYSQSCLGIKYPASDFHGFPQSFQLTARIVSGNKQSVLASFRVLSTSLPRVVGRQTTV